ncbi:MAG TPA: DNA polymerase/3'-5' exonuclease PolX [Thermoanaerobaculia bacterium]|nr:DNA polymerase/3'-5' exonuclease PolX [Thermoanaerobaculia bacterium]
MDNPEIARILDEVADVLEIKSENPFRIRAYRNAVRTIESLTVPLRRMTEQKTPLTTLPGIGKDMERHILEMIETGTLGYRDQLLSEVPRSLIDLMRLPGVGPKKAHKLWDELKICSVDELEAAAKEGRIATVPGFGAKTQEKILAGIQDRRQHSSRLLLQEAERHVEPLLAYLRAVPGIERLEVAGSYRRRRETVGDIDLLATTTAGPAGAAAVMEAFRAYPQVSQVLMAGDTRSSVSLGSGLQVDLRVVPPESYGAALVYFTGSKDHNVKLRRRAVERGLRISEYGVYKVAESSEDPDGEWIAGREEADVYATVGLPWIPPEIREDWGEIETAAAGRVPDLIRVEDFRGDLHMHSVWSDGRNTLEEMVAACVARGYEYMAISDHSKNLPMVNGLDARRLTEQWREIEAVRARHPEIRLLRSMEVDILGDGSLDLEDEMLAGLDRVIVSGHTRFEMPADEQTRRILRALEHPAVHVFAHPTARLINRRKPIDFDVDAVLTRAAELGVAVELNSNPHRLDLKDAHLRLAKERGCKIVVNTDSHRTQELDLLRYGVEQARRAGLEARDVLNTLPLPQFLAAVARQP